jgi:23S rRNA maturation mini-RNase III
MGEFTENMAQPFLEKAKRIEKNLAILEKETLPPEISADIRHVKERYAIIRNFLLLRIENKCRYHFKNQNLFLIVFLHKEISKIFNDVQNLVANGSAKIEIPDEIFPEMLQLKETMMSLAFIGDSAIELGVIRSIWPQNDLHEIPLKRKLDSQKKFITVGKNQAVLWNFLNLSDEKISPSSESARLKASQFEAIFGILYLEAGQDAVESAISTLKKNNEKDPVSGSPGK